MIQVSNLSVHFPSPNSGTVPVRALDGVSLRCARGRITGILGGKNAGKTTLLRTLAGQIRPTTGEAKIAAGDTPCDSLRPRDRIGVVTPETVLFDRLTPYEILDFVAKIRAINRTRFEHRVHAVAEQMELRDILHRRTDSLSTGQNRKVALAAALLHEPDVLLFDDPTSGLDAPATSDLHRCLRAEADQGRTIVLAGHTQTQVAELCDDLHVLHQGRIRHSGTPRAVAEMHPSGRLDLALSDLCRTPPSPESAPNA